MNNFDLSIITPLYRARDFLADYLLRVQKIALHLKQAGLTLELVLVTADSTEWEVHIMGDLTRALDAAETGSITQVEVAYTTPAAAWNAGITASAGRALAIWPIQHDRTVEALIEGQQLIKAGYDLVDFPHTLHWSRQWLGLFTTQHEQTQPPQYGTEAPDTSLSPFCMFSRAIYDAIGPFDEGKNVPAMHEWGTRPAARAAQFQTGAALAGSVAREQ